MANGWEDDGAWGSASRVPVDQWFPVQTSTGAWQLPGQPTLASSAGMPDVNAPAVMGGMPDQAPLATFQVAGTFAPPLGPQPRMQAVARAGQAGLLTPQPSIWESIARGVGRASPTGRAILQGFDQQQQQGLQNRLALRRQQLKDEQEARQGVKDEYTTLVAISQLKNKALRNMQFDRFAARAAEAGTALPPDFIDAYKKSSLAEGEGIAQAYGPLLEQAGFSPTQTARILEGGDLDTIKGLLEGGLKVQKQTLDEAEEARLTASRQMLFGASPGAGTEARARAETAQAPQANVGMREAPAPAPNAPMPIRMHNPLNIKQGAATQKWVDQGVAVPGDNATDGGRFLKFGSPSQGVQAAQDLLTGPTYRDLTVDAALKKWSNQGYGGEIVSGVDGQKKIAALTPDELTRTMGAMIKREGGAPALAADVSRMVTGPGATGADQAQLTRLNQQIAAMDQFLAANIGSGRERTKGMVHDVQQERTRLIGEREKMLETPRALDRQRQEQPLKLEQQRAGAEVALEAKSNEPIGTDNARKMGLPPGTKWKDVPQDVRVLEDPSPAERKVFSDVKASHEGIGRVLGMLEQPGAQKIVGTLFSEPEASFNRRVGEWLSTVTPEQRKFVASLATEIAELRHQLSGAAVSPQEFAVLKPMFPDPGDPDVATVRAKLEALREWVTRKHDAYRDQLDQVNIRTPKALTRPAEPPPKDPKERLLEKYTR